MYDNLFLPNSEKNHRLWGFYDNPNVAAVLAGLCQVPNIEVLSTSTRSRFRLLKCDPGLPEEAKTGEERRL